MRGNLKYEKIAALFLSVIITFFVVACGENKGDEKFCVNCNKNVSAKLDVCETCDNELYTHAKPKSDGVQNVIDRAYAFTDVEWTPLKDVPGYKGRIFEAGVTYKGIPYSAANASDGYIGMGVNLESFLTALKSENSVLYTENLSSTNSKAATYYGTVCSKMVEYTLDIGGLYNTNNVVNIPGMQIVGFVINDFADEIQLGDVVVNVGKHTTICTDILYDKDGNVAYIEISEATIPVARRKYWNPDEFFDHFIEYWVCRYDYIDDVPKVPKTSLQDSYSLMPRLGDKYNYKQSATQKGVVDVLESGYYKAVVLRNGTKIDEIILDGATSFSFDRSVTGNLEMYLEKQDGQKSGSVYACVVDSSIVVQDCNFDEGKMKVSVDGSSGSPLYVQVGEGHVVFCNIKGTENEAEIAFESSKVSSKKVRVAYQNEYGTYFSNWVSFSVE